MIFRQFEQFRLCVLLFVMPVWSADEVCVAKLQLNLSLCSFFFEVRNPKALFKWVRSRGGRTAQRFVVG